MLSDRFKSFNILRPMFFGAVISGVGILLCFYGVAAPFFLLVAAVICLLGAAVFRLGEKGIVIPLVLFLVTMISVAKTESLYRNMSRIADTVGRGKLTVIDDGKYENRLTVRVYGYSYLPYGTKVLLKCNDDDIKMGDVLEGTVSIETVYDRENNSYMFSNGIKALISCDDVSNCGTNHYYRAVKHIRKYVSDALYKNLSEKESSTLNALLIGDTTDFDNEFELRVRNSGLSHIMVVSGMHFAIIMGVFNSFIRRIGIKRRVGTVLSFGFMFLFISVCGFTGSVLRSALTCILVGISAFCGRDKDSLNILSGAVALLLAVFPYLILSISFQLSVLATFGIIVLTPMTEKYLYMKLPNIKPLKYIITPLLTSLSAGISTLPVMIWNFKSVSLAAPLSNIFVSFAVSVVMPVTLFTVAVNFLLPFEFVCKPLYFLTGLLAKYINFSIDFFGSNEDVIINLNDTAVTGVSFIILMIPVIRRIISKYQYKSELRRRYGGDYF